jgi:hypothetical protein
MNSKASCVGHLHFLTLIHLYIYEQYLILFCMYVLHLNKQYTMLSLNFNFMFLWYMYIYITSWIVLFLCGHNFFFCFSAYWLLSYSYWCWESIAIHILTQVSLIICQNFSRYKSKNSITVSEDMCILNFTKRCQVSS